MFLRKRTNLGWVLVARQLTRRERFSNTLEIEKSLYCEASGLDITDSWGPNVVCVFPPFVSEGCLSAPHGEAVGVCDKNRTFELLDYYKSQGGNFIDLANFYQDGQSESWVGEWMAKKQCRDEMVIATKYSLSYKRYGDHKHIIQEKLKSDCIYILYVHHWTYDTAIEDLMLHLNHMVASGKALFLGCSDFPAWMVTKCNQYARDHSLHQFVVYQGMWNASERAFEREILPMCRAEGMALAPFNVLVGGALKTEAQWNHPVQRPVIFAMDRHKAVSKVLEDVATRKGTQLICVAIAYVMHKAPACLPRRGDEEFGADAAEHRSAGVEFD